MKRTHDNSEVVELIDDVWSVVINLYYHLQYKEQWLKLKEVCATSCRFILPLDEIEVPLYDDMRTPPEIIICYRIHYLIWNKRGICGLNGDVHEFLCTDPHRNRTPFNKSLNMILTGNITKSILMSAKGTTISIPPAKTVLPIGIMNISLNCLPRYLFA